MQQEEGQTATVQALIAKGANVNAHEMHGYTSLMWAVIRGQGETARVLVDHGAQINAQEKKKAWTALMRAAVKGDAPMVRLLLEKGADINVTDAGGATALAAAKKKGDPATIQLLERAKARDG